MAMTMALVRAMAAAAPDRMFKDLQIAEEPDMDLEVATVLVTVAAMAPETRIVRDMQELLTRTLLLIMELVSVAVHSLPAFQAATAEAPLVQALVVLMALRMTRTLDSLMELPLVQLPLTADTAPSTLQKRTVVVPLAVLEAPTTAIVLNEPTEAIGLTEQRPSFLWLAQSKFYPSDAGRFGPY
mmetsp:Transcript_7337/g.12545  ORF Transcript_7337/g.12545 Transcript_7337/m.12545 type:complete len:184 (+) Transcript_7337:651-1202(+)